VLTNDGLNLTGWTLLSPTAISADGNTIVGFGTEPGGSREAWIATVPSPAPVCSCWPACSALRFHDARRRERRRWHRYRLDSGLESLSSEASRLSLRACRCEGQALRRNETQSRDEPPRPERGRAHAASAARAPCPTLDAAPCAARRRGACRGGPAEAQAVIVPPLFLHHFWRLRKHLTNQWVTVEAAGIEPASEWRPTSASTCIGLDRGRLGLSRDRESPSPAPYGSRPR